MTSRVLRRALLGAALLTAGGASAQDLTLTPPDGRPSGSKSVLADVNRDGVKDYILSASDGFTFENGFASANDANVTVYDGKTGALLYTFQDPEANDGFSRYGLGLAAGDVNGDWFADIAVGSSSANGGAGAVYVYSGRTGELMMTLTSPNPEPNGGFGEPVDIANVVGFFVSDIVVGASGESVDGVASAGRAYVYLGSYFSRYRGLLAATLQSPAPQRFGRFGFRLTSADFNLDWRNDPVVAATGEGRGNGFNAGRAYIFKGGIQGLRHGSLLATVTPPDLSNDEAFGILDMAAGDFDGDWRPDLALALPEDGGGSQLGAGIVYVYTNPNADAPALTLTSPNAVGSEDDDPVGGGGFGRAVSAADLDGDGDAELVVSAASEDGRGGLGDGVVYVLDGRTGGVLRQIDAATPGQPSSFRSFGFDVAAARDHKGSRLLVGDVGSNEGYVYVNPLDGDTPRLNPARVVAQAQTDGVDPTTRLRVPTFTAAEIASAAAEAEDALAVGLTALAAEAGESALAVAPNPSAGRAQASFTLAEAVEGRVAVYDVLGREVAVLAQGTLAAQTHTLAVEGLAPGAYVVRLDAPGVSQTARLTVVR